MTIDEAIKHCLEVAEHNENLVNWGCNTESTTNDCKECAADHRQLAEWLRELKELSLQQNAPRLGSIEEYHYELARCKTAFWSCNKRCMDAEEQYRRKADELREAKRLLRLAVEDITFILSYACSDEEMCCEECPTVNHACNKWRYADEALKLLNEEI